MCSDRTVGLWELLGASSSGGSGTRIREELGSRRRRRPVRACSACLLAQSFSCGHPPDERT